MASRSRWRVVAVMLAAVAVTLVVSQWRAIYTENINWDEFALLARAQDSIRTGTLRGGGRPGLVSLMLVPVVRDCNDAVSAVTSARPVWLGFTILYLTAIFMLVRAVAPDPRRAWPAAAAAVASIALVPVFLRWSLHVRTDQPALMFACWGAVALLAALRWLPYGFIAGALFALGYLCSQKAAYVGAATMIVFALRLAPDLEWRRITRRQLLPLVAAGAGFVAMLLTFDAVVWIFYHPPVTVTLQSQLDIFAYYERVFGYRAYDAMLPSLTAHGLFAGLLLVALVISGRRPLRNRGRIVACWLMILLGVAVGLFHRGAFPYFWMTLGLFAALATGLGWPALVEVFGPRVMTIAPTLAAGALALYAVPAAFALHSDTQAVQRDAVQFVDRHFARDARGFQAESLFFCRADPDPFPTYFADTTQRFFAGPEGDARAATLVEEFRRRPVSFTMVNRLFRFPEPVQRFIDTHYTPYKYDVMVPGREVAGTRGASIAFDVIVPGAYRWMTGDASATIQVDGNGLQPGQTLPLTVGTHAVTLDADVRSGMLVVALNEDPQIDGPSFYAPTAVKELDPLYPRVRR